MALSRAGISADSTKRILVGHSIGCASLMTTVAEDPSKVAAIVLEDPVVVPLLGGSTAEARQLGEFVVYGTDARCVKKTSGQCITSDMYSCSAFCIRGLDAAYPNKPSSQLLHNPV